ncbi:hypothetical protein EJ08DRAFT_682842 [Tothia fuscella]|uniref:Uncharacterized protein n=1 Tax=Tothia fuscella TaxID=1048955 RepID=A0A9P4NHC0_9PEZI|nr:hypothetical protein EJ08DRAFT_682842 [Tothia fuscella]
MVNLKIQAIPYRPSNLSIPPSPFSPKSPLTPVKTLKQAPAPCYVRRVSIAPATPPSAPLQWLWQCHSCRSTYPIAATRRCLEDGHFFCAGTTIVKKKTDAGAADGKVLVKRHKACASEFDYQSWKAWGEWRRLYFVSADSKKRRVKQMGVKRDCWNFCDYPSECRWGKQVIIDSPKVGQVSPLLPDTDEIGETSPLSPLSPENPEPATTFDSSLQGVEKQKQKENPPAASQPRKDDFWTVLLASATRRKSTKSPLSLSTVVEDAEGDIEMVDVCPRAAVTVPLPSLQMPKVDFTNPFDIEGGDGVEHAVGQMQSGRGKTR